MRFHDGTLDQPRGTLSGSMANSVLVLLVAVVIVCAVFATAGLVSHSVQTGCGGSESTSACAEDSAG